MLLNRLFTALSFAAACAPNAAIHAQQTNKIVVRPNELVSEVQPTMWGIFFEDINLGADGGIYAELVKNRSFEFSAPLMGWTVQQNTFNEAAVLVINRQIENTANPRFARITKNSPVDSLSLTNEGFRGMGIKKGLSYHFSVMYRQRIPGLSMQVELLNAKEQPIGNAVLVPSGTEQDGWKKDSLSFTASDTAWKGKLRIRFTGSGSIDLDMISLFPGDTWKNRPGGMRADMIQLLADLKPGFIRFPGGCIVEGADLSLRYQWKKTIGPVEERQLIMNRWNNEFKHRPAPDYFQTFGLGFFEYFQLAEDIGAEPLPILNAGMACQFNTAEVAPIDQLDPYVQDALDLIEFANGDPTTKWGGIRASMGHAAPFNLKMMGVGNENWGPQYLERLEVFTKAIKARYPGFKLVNSSGTDPDGQRFEFLNTQLRKMNVDIIDEHYYRRPSWFLANATRYDNYPRNGPKVFAGEYAAQSDKTVSIENKNNAETAISEAAFMTGLERNAAVVNLASYAPLFAHAEGWQWTPDLIWVNNLQAYGTPNYYVQKLYSNNKGTHVVPALSGGKALSGQDSVYASAVVDKNKGELIIKLVNASATGKTNSISIEGAGKLPNQAIVTVLKSDDPAMVNSFENPMAVAPMDANVPVKGRQVEYVAAPHSFSVIKIKL